MRIRAATFAFLLTSISAATGARTILQTDLDANGFRVYNPHAPTLATDVLRLTDVLPSGSPCILQSTASGVPICSTLTGFSASPPLVLTGSVLSLSIDSSLAVSGGNLQRTALTGAVVAAAGSNATTFGNLAGLSVLGRAAGSTGVPAAITSTTSGDALWNNAGTLGWAPYPYAALSGAPASLPPSGSAGGDLGSTYPNPTVIASEWSGTRLTFGTLADGALPKRSGTSLVAAVPAVDYQQPVSAADASIVFPTATTVRVGVVPPGSTSGIVANWPIANMRWYAVKTGGSDSNACYSDTSMADAGTKACATVAGLAAVFPKVGANHQVTIAIEDGTYTDNLSLALNGAGGYQVLRVRGTGTVASAGATSFADDAADDVALGAVTATGMNAGGYNATGSPTTTVVQLVKAGGGAPGFPSDESTAPLPLGARFRCDSATATASLRNVARSIVQISGTDTVSVPVTNPLPAAPTGSDVCYIEMPGVTVTANLQGMTQSVSFAGLSFTSGSSVLRSAAMLLAFSRMPGTFGVTDVGTFSVATTFSGAAGNFTVGGVRFDGALTVTRSTTTLQSSVCGGGIGFNFVSGTSLSMSGNPVFANLQIQDSGFSASQNYSFVTLGVTSTIDYARVVGGFSGQGVSVASTKLKIANVRFYNFALGFSFFDKNDVSVSMTTAGMMSGTGTASGGQTLSAGWDLTRAYGSTLTLFGHNVSGAYTLTGASGDFLLATDANSAGGNVAGVNIAPASYSDVSNAGELIDRSGNRIRLGELFTNQGQQTHAIPILAVNVTGSDIPAGKLVVLTSGVQIASLAQGDTDAHAAGVLAVTLTTIKDFTTSGFLARGYVSTRLDQYPALSMDGSYSSGQSVYVSPTTAGNGTTTAPTGAQSRRRVGMASGSASIRFDPDISSFAAVATSGSATDLTTGTVPCARLPAQTGDVTTSGCAATISANAVTNGDIRQSAPLSVIARSANSTGNVADVSATAASDAVLRESGSTIGFGTVATGGIASHAVTNSKIRQGVGESVVGVTGGSTADVADIAATGNGQCLQTVAGAVVWAACPSPGGGTVTNVTASLPLASSGGTAPDLTLNFDASLALSGSNLQRAALTGDVNASAGSNSLGLVNIPTDTTMAGDILATNIAAPSTPSSGHARCYVDSTSLNWVCKNSGALLNHGVQSNAGAAHQFVTSLSDAGALTTAQPSYPDISGSVPAITSLTGPVTGTGPGATATTISAAAVSSANLRNSDATSVIGRSANSVGVPGDIDCSADNEVVYRSGGILGCSLFDYSFLTGKPTFPTASDVLVSPSSGISPTGDSNFQYDTANHRLTLSLSDSSGITLRMNRAGLQAIQKEGGSGGFEIGILHSASLGLYTNNVDRLILDGSGNLQLPHYGAGYLKTDSSGNVTAGQVTSIQESSGPTTLTFGAIPDSTPDSTILIRPAGASTVVGISSSTFLSTSPRSLDYFIDIPSLQPANTASRWLATSMADEVAAGGTVEYPNNFTATHISQKIYIISSVGTASTIDCSLTRNGSTIAGTTLTFTPGTTAAGTLISSGSQATGSASASDTYGAACQYNGNFVTGPFGATIAFSIQTVLTP